MPNVINFEEWKVKRLSEMKEKNEMVDCPFCDDGYKECPECCHEACCEECEGSGRIEYSLCSFAVEIKYPDYFEIVVKDLKDWCVFTREDFLLHIGKFIKENDNGIRSIR